MAAFDETWQFPIPSTSRGRGFEWDSRDEALMDRAIALARSVPETATLPNPRVGALIVEDGIIVSEGYHARDGGPHAERIALHNLGRLPKHEAQMIVTLEPCSTTGRTGSCCERILAARNIRRVVIGTIDPNPAHAGRGIRLLLEARIEVVWGVRTAACEALNPRFNARMLALPRTQGRHRKLPSHGQPA
ncbi:MAG: bifunctional diaminohydroxyphosphoribosylaminopyrimidine deaminase/5-amino-6-(5-phosphoribosylamino)uracil reductase RibD [Verrucomicrobiota bacterium JB024]|nr:bifunctional diaminohydroxyphosphoribosylaminopyrimidine deaminase/5-amino-6-(5-phosphoribosylamino)uracil reductase RibD [Verrucomicrobiota bacterium JB024]